MKPAVLWVAFILALMSACSTPQGHVLTDYYREQGLVDIQGIDPGIQVRLVLSRPYWNVFRKDYYQGLDKAFLRKEAVYKLTRAQKALRKRHPEYSLLVIDAMRPNQVSHKMHEQMKDTLWKHFVADPHTGSMHNYGAAVDICIVDKKGRILDFGFLPFYQSRVKVMLNYKRSYDASGREKPLAPQQKANRLLLRQIMLEAGWVPLDFEWWHFNAFPKKTIREKYNRL